MPALVETPRTAGHKTWIEVRLDRLRANLKMIQLAAGPDTRIIAGC